MIFISFYLIPVIIHLVLCLWGAVYERNRIGYVKGDTVGMFIVSFVPLLNFILLFAMAIILINKLVNNPNHYFKKK